MTTQSPPHVFSLRFSGPGLIVASAFFALSLYASLLPRTGLFQGIVSGHHGHDRIRSGCGDAKWERHLTTTPSLGSAHERFQHPQSRVSRLGCSLPSSTLESRELTGIPND
jgi:hypothetical protein